MANVQNVSRPKSVKPHYQWSPNGPQLRGANIDGLVNVFSGMGTGNSQSSHNTWQYTRWMSGHVIDVVYRESWLSQAICSIPAEDATREWRHFNGDKSEDIERYENNIDLQTKVCEAKTFARAYGGAGILMVTDQDLAKPLDLKRVKQGSLKKLIVLDRFDLSAPLMNITNPLADNYLLPEYYTLVNGSQKIHWTHIARFEGLKLPRRLAAIEHGWGDSELRRVLDDVNSTVASFMGIAHLMQQANVDVITAEGLSDDLTSGEDKKIIERYNLFNLMKSNYGLSLLDATETLERLTLQLTGVAPVQEQLITWISGAARIPVTRLFGTSAKGMNATGEGDERIYYDRIKADQNRSLRPALQHIDQVLVRSAIGDYPDDFDFTWNPLSQLTDEDQANVDYTDSQTDKTYFEMGTIRRSHIMKKLQQKDTYQISDDEIEEMEKREAEEAKLLAEAEHDDNFQIGGEGEGDGDKSNTDPAE